MTSAKNTTEQDEEQDAGNGEVSETEKENGLEPAEEKTPAEVTKPKEPNQKVRQVSTGKRPLGTKEVIPFQWKLVGVSDGIALTLFKAVEREDVEAQLERSEREGYYTDLRILDIDEKVVQPKPPKPPKAAVRRRAKKARRPPAKAAKQKKPAKVKSAARSTAKKGAKKAPAKAAKKKKASPKSTKKKAKKRKQ